MKKHYAMRLPEGGSRRGNSRTPDVRTEEQDMEMVIGAVAAVVFFLVAYKVIKTSKRQREETSHYVCDVCKGEICECRPDNGRLEP
jgi:hypothetical protein